MTARDSSGLTSTNEVSIRVVRPPAQLTVVRVAEGIVLYWPAAAASWTLEESEALPAGLAWKPVLTPPLVQGAWNRLESGLAGQARFFRLRRRRRGAAQP